MAQERSLVAKIWLSLPVLSPKAVNPKDLRTPPFGGTGKTKEEILKNGKKAKNNRKKIRKTARIARSVFLCKLLFLEKSVINSLSESEKIPKGIPLLCEMPFGR